MAGAPIGNTNALRGRRWSAAIERALDKWPNKPESLSINKGIDDAAFAFVSKLMSEPDLGYFKELGDRLDGKPAQAIVGDSSHDPIQVQDITIRAIDAASYRPTEEG